jgi:hypothetical protein
MQLKLVKHETRIILFPFHARIYKSAVYKALFDQGFDARDALEDVKALHLILFSTPLNLLEIDLITHCQAITFVSRTTRDARYHQATAGDFHDHAFSDCSMQFGFEYLDNLMSLV